MTQTSDRDITAQTQAAPVTVLWDPAVATYNFYQRHTRAVLGNTDALSNVLLAHLSGEAKAGAGGSKPKAKAEDD